MGVGFWSRTHRAQVLAVSVTSSVTVGKPLSVTVLDLQNEDVHAGEVPLKGVTERMPGIYSLPVIMMILFSFTYEGKSVSERGSALPKVTQQLGGNASYRRQLPVGSEVRARSWHGFQCLGPETMRRTLPS